MSGARVRGVGDGGSRCDQQPGEANAGTQRVTTISGVRPEAAIDPPGIRVTPAS